MCLLFHLLPLLACLHTAWPFPVREDEGSFLENYGSRLAKKSYYPYKESILSPFGFLEHPRPLSQGQRKKAVDSTFIRFGRSWTGQGGRNERSVDDQHALSSGFDDPDGHQSDSQSSDLSDLPDLKLGLQQRFLLHQNGCRISNAQELRKVLMTDPNCLRALQRAKKENVNDTFIRFGKREAPPEKEFESQNSEGTS